MKTTREFAPADRYTYDFGVCSYAKGFAQFDSPQDASYYGMWCSPTRRMIVSYCEGDVTMHEAETDQEFVEALDKISAWNVEHQGGPARIDPGLNPAMKEAFIAIGAAHLLYPELSEPQQWTPETARQRVGGTFGT